MEANEEARLATTVTVVNFDVCKTQVHDVLKRKSENRNISDKIKSLFCQTKTKIYRHSGRKKICAGDVCKCEIYIKLWI
jgi:hypothetical protein